MNSKIENDGIVSFGMRTTYIRDKSRLPLACVVAIRKEDEPDFLYVGISVWNGKDKFDKRLARRIAEGRAKKVLRSDFECFRGMVVHDEGQGWPCVFKALYDLDSDEKLPKRVLDALSERMSDPRVSKPVLSLVGYVPKDMTN